MKDHDFSLISFDKFIFIPRHLFSFSRTFQYAIALLALFSLLQQPIESWVSECRCFNRLTYINLVLFLCNRKKVIIHVPYRVKNVKHVHTIYKIIPHYREDKKEDLEEDDKYEIY